MEVDLTIRTQQAQQRVEELKSAIERIGKIAPDNWATNQLADQLKRAREEAEKLASQLEDQGTASKVFLQGVGGEELPEKLGKITEGLRIAGDSGQGLTTRLQGLGGAVGLALGPLGRMASALDELDSAFQAHRNTLRELGPAYAGIESATGGLVTAERALADRQMLLREHLPATAQQFGELERAMQNYAAAAGGDASSAMTTFMRAIQEGNDQALVPFGVTLDHTKSQAEQLTDALRQMRAQGPGGPERPTSTAGRIFDTLRNVGSMGGLERARAEQAADANRERGIAIARGQEASERALLQAQKDREALVADLARRDAEASEQVSLLEKATRDAREESERFEAVLREGVGPGLKDFTIHAREAAGAHDEFLSPMAAKMDEAQGSVQRLTEAELALAHAADDAAKAHGQLYMRLNEGEDAGQALERIVQGARQQIALNREQANMATLAARTLLQQGFTAAQIRGVPGLGSALPSGGGGGNSAARQAAAEALEQVHQAEAAHARLDEITRKSTESMVEYWHAVRDNAREAIALQEQWNRVRAQGLTQEEARWTEVNRRIDRDIELLREREQLLNEQDTARKESAAQQADAANGAGSAAQQFARQFGGLAEQNVSAAQQMAQGVGGAFQALTGAVQSHFQALIEGRESGAQALQGIVHDTLAALAQMAVVQSLVEVAAGIASLAIENYKGAIQHFAAAGVYAGVAVLAGVGAAAIPSPSAAASAAGAGPSGSPREANAVPPSSNASREPVTNVYYISGLFGEKAEDELVNMQDRASARGRRPRSVRQLERARG